MAADLTSYRPGVSLWIAMGLVSVALHGALGAGLSFWEAPPAEKPVRVPVEVVVREEPPPPPEPEPPPPEPEPEPEPPPAEPEPPRAPVVQKKPPKRPKPPKTPETPKPPPEAPPPKPAAPPMLSGMNFEGASTAIKGPGVAINQGSTQGSRRGRPDGTGTGDPPPNPEADVVPVAGVSTLPVLVDEVKPEYPDDLKRAGVEGKVVLSLVVGVDGRVRSAKLVKRLHPELDRRAQQAARRLRFKPAKTDGTPVAVRIPYTFYFVID